MWPVFTKEINSFFNSLMAYIIIGVFLVSMGLIIWVFPDTSVLQYGFADLDALFTLAPYVFMFLIPAITMRMFSEEKKAGTLELLYTRPLRDSDIILGKYLASVAIVLIALAPTLLYYFTVYYLGSPVGNIDTAGTMGSYIGLILLGGVFAAIGLFASSLTENQVIAFVVAVFLCFIIYSGFGSLAALGSLRPVATFIDQLGILYHYQALSKGLVDSRDVIYFVSMAALALWCTRLILSMRKW
jgi:ABC-2 type transport system permease protein